jgi:hypothetical protein
MFGLNKLARLRTQQARLLAEIRFLDRIVAGDSVSSYYADKMLDRVGDLAVVEHQIKKLEDRHGTA